MLKVAFQMDPLEGLNVKRDTSLVLIREAYRRGHTIWHYLPENLVYDQGEVYALGTLVEVQGGHVSLKGELTRVSLAECNVVWIRQNPPFTMEYLTPTYVLKHLPPTTRVYNSPGGLREAPEKLSILRFPEFIPPTLVTANWSQICEFHRRHGDIVLKPLYDYGGRSVFRIPPEAPNFESIYHLLREQYKTPLMAQPFLSEVFVKGDKRILLVDGEPVGCFIRLPKEDDFRSNTAVGGTPMPAPLTDRDLAICHALKPVLNELGVFFVGLDVIGDFLTEINITSPTGLPILNELNNLRLEKDIWDRIEKNFS